MLTDREGGRYDGDRAAGDDEGGDAGGEERNEFDEDEDTPAASTETPFVSPAPELDEADEETNTKPSPVFEPTIVCRPSGNWETNI